MAFSNFINVRQPAKALLVNGFACGGLTKGCTGLCTMCLTKGVTASGQRHSFFRIHRHAGKGSTHVTCRLQRIGVAARAFWVDVYQTHLDCG